MAARAAYNACTHEMSREMKVQISPAQAIAARGLQKQWVAAQLGISPAYLSMLLNGNRRWTPDLAGKFPLVVGLASAALCFAPNCKDGVHSLGTSHEQSPAEAPAGAQERDDAPSEYSDTPARRNGPQSAKTAEPDGARA